MFLRPYLVLTKFRSNIHCCFQWDSSLVSSRRPKRGRISETYCGCYRDASSLRSSAWQFVLTDNYSKKNNSPNSWQPRLQNDIFANVNKNEWIMRTNTNGTTGTSRNGRDYRPPIWTYWELYYFIPISFEKKSQNTWQALRRDCIFANVIINKN